VSKPNEGYVFQRGNKWVARVTFTDPATGKRKEQWKTGKTEQHARELLVGMLASLPEQKASLDALNSDNSHSSAPTFKTVAAQYAAHKIKPAVYRENRKIAGLRSERTTRIRLAVLLDYFGEMPIDRITNATVDRFRIERLNTPTQYKHSDGTPKERAIASVNRELELLRSVMLWAVGEGYIQKAPRAPIVKAHETKRTRVLSPTEEKKLLKACDTPDRKHIIPVIIFALTTGARANEIKQVKWSDVDLKARTITLRATTTKTNKPRTLPLSERLLSQLMAMPDAPRESRIFKMTTWQKSWNAACRDAGIVGLRFHDLRATFITRMIEKGMPVELVAKLSGHADASTLYAHYLRPQSNAVEQARAILDGNAP
jgi:integrase